MLEAKEWSTKIILCKEYNIQPSETDIMPNVVVAELLNQLGDDRRRQKLEEALMKQKLEQSGMGIG